MGEKILSPVMSFALAMEKLKLFINLKFDDSVAMKI